MSENQPTDSARQTDSGEPQRHEHAALHLRHWEACEALDRAIPQAEGSIRTLEQQWADYEKMLEQEGSRFRDFRNSLNQEEKLGRHARKIGELDEPASPVIKRPGLKHGLDELYSTAESLRSRARVSWFKKQKVAQAVANIEEGRARIRYATEHGEQPFNREEDALLADLRQKIADARPAVEEWSEANAEASPAWASPDWEQWEPATAIPYGIRLGLGASRPTPVGPVQATSTWCVNGGRSLFLWKHQTDVVLQVQSLILRLLAQFPPGMARFVFVDPLGAGKDVAPFLHLSDYDEGLVGGKVWSESSDIEARLTELQAHIEMVVQKYLRGQFTDIEAHNAAAGEIAEAYRFLVIFDFPANFTEAAARRLVSIARNGPACGVYAIVVAAPGREMPHGFDGSELDGPTMIFTPVPGESTGSVGLSRVTGHDSVSPWRIDFERPPSLTLTDPGEEQNLFTRVISGIGSKAKAATNVEVSERRLLELLESTLAAGLTEHQPVVDVAPKAEDQGTWWTGDAAHGIAAPIGRIGARAVQSLALVGTDTSVHALVAGKTGSGKSTLLHATILNLCMLYSPDELELYLVDFKQGVEFKPYAVGGLPHARVVAIESEREFGLSVLRGLEREINSRGEQFRAHGVDDLADFRRETGEAMPRILLVADEFHVLFADDDGLANEAARILDRLVRQGRSFGVHVILASQTISGVHQVGRGTMNQIAVRIALQCTESDSQVIFGEDNPDARLLSRPGEAIYNSMNGRPEGNRRFQVVMLQDEEREQIVERLRELADQRGHERRPVVFEGNAQADPRNNGELERLLDGEAEANPKRLRAWLGEPISLEGPVAVDFDRRAGANLLCVGPDREVTDGVLTSVLAALVPQLGGAPGAIDVLDFGGLDEPFGVAANELSRLSGGLVRVGRRRQMEEVLGRLADELAQRIEAPSLPAEPRLLVIHRLQSARELDSSDLGFGSDAEGPAKQLTAILRDGAEFGIHVLASCDTVTNLERRLEPAAQREFGLRLVTRMSENDSLHLIDKPDAAKLVGAQAIFLDEDRSESTKLRAYGSPTGEWLASVVERPGWVSAGDDQIATGSAEPA